MSTSPFFGSPRRLRILSIIAVIFGVGSVFSGGMVLFGPGKAAQLAGDILPFIVWFNFLSGFFYVAAGIGLFQRATWAAHLSTIIALACTLFFAALIAAILNDSTFETRTLAAMTFRTLLWVVIALTARKILISQSASLT